MIMRPRVRKFALAAHLTFSVGWIGAVIAYVGLGVTANRSPDAQTVRGTWIAMELVGWYVIVPLALGSFASELLMALGTKWGLFQHYWVLISFVLTAFFAVVLLSHMPDVSAMADIAREADATTLAALGGDLFHSSLGLVVLLAVQVLNICKPPGITRYGWRKQSEQRRGAYFTSPRSD